MTAIREASKAGMKRRAAGGRAPGFGRMLVLCGLWVLLVVVVLGRTAGAVRPRVVATGSPGKVAGPRLALLVGVGRYPEKVAVGQIPWRVLHTHDEIVALRKVLIERHGFLPKDILVLEDQQASGAAIRAAFASHLISRASRGAVVFFHFSGHGQSLLDKNGDELDGLDESIVPGDAQDQSAAAGERTNVLDDEFAGWLRTLGDKLRGADGKVDGSIVLSFDSCFSGTMARGDLVERGRGWDVALDGPAPTPDSLQSDEGSRSAEAQQHARATLDLDARDYVLLTAARSDQTAKESGGMGVYSRALVAALTRLPIGVSYRTLLHELGVEMRRTVSNQTPELEGSPDRALFGAAAAKPEPSFFAVSQVKGDQIELPVGILHQVTEGSVYALHRQGTDPLSEATRLGEASVIAVQPTSSWLRLRAGGKRPSEAELAGARVVETEHVFATQPLRVSCQAASGGLCVAPALRAALSGLADAKLVLPSSPDGAAGTASYDVKIVATAAQLELYRPECGTPFATIPARLQGDAQAQALTERLRAEWRWRRLFALHGQSDFAQVAVRLVPVRASRSAAGIIQETPTPQAKSGARSLRIPEGGLYQLEVQNDSPGPVYLTVLELGPDGRIGILFPRADRPGDAHIAARKEPRLIGLPYVFETESPPGGWTLKAIVTLEPTDFGSLVQEASTLRQAEVGTRGNSLRQRASQHPLGELLLESVTGGLLRSRIPPVAVGTWATDTVLLDVVALREAASARPASPSIPSQKPPR